MIDERKVAELLSRPECASPDEFEQMVEAWVSSSDLPQDNPFSVSDWRDGSLYPCGKHIGPHHWKWEFSRRSNWVRWLWLTGYVTNSDNVSLDPRLRFDALAADALPLQSPVYSFDYERQGHVALTDFDNSERPVSLQVIATQIQDQILAIIDPDQPLDRQFNKIKRLVQSKMAVAPRRGSRTSDQLDAKYPLYLRVLDATDKFSPFAATVTELARTLYPDNDLRYATKKCYDLLKQAADVYNRFDGGRPDRLE